MPERTAVIVETKPVPSAVRSGCRRGAVIGRGEPYRGDSLTEMLDLRATCQPDEIAYTFLRDGERPDASYTWRDLRDAAFAIGAWLAPRCRPGDRVLLMYPPGLDFVAAFFGCLHAGVLPVPVPPAPAGRGRRGHERLGAIIRDAEPRLALSAGGREGVPVQADAVVSDAHTLGIDTVFTDRLGARPVMGTPSPGAARSDVAFLQYTSGSTASPRGVMVTHGNLLHNLRAAFELGDTTPDSVSVSWLPVTHDMGLIEGVLQPAFSGCPAYLMSPGAFLQRPVRWLRAISSYGATRSGGPNFAYDLVASRVNPGALPGLDLSRWRAAYNGAEPVRADTMHRFTRALAPYGFRPEAFRPCYGLAEATLLVATSRWRATDDDRPVSCGRPPHGTGLRVVDPETGAACLDGEVGEIQVRGASVTRGYWNRPDETAATYIGDGTRWLRTGDLGVLRDGELTVTGRLKDLLIVRGAKHFPQDLERTAERTSPHLRRGAVAAVSIADDVRGDRIVLVAELEVRQPEPAPLEEALVRVRQATADEHGIQLHGVALVPAGTLPRTTSGKLQRFRVRDAWTAGTLGPVALWCAG